LLSQLVSNSRILSPNIVGEEHYRTAQRVKESLHHYKELQDIIAILGMKELSEEESPGTRRITAFVTPYQKRTLSNESPLFTI